MIEQLSKNQSLWIKYANSICKDSDLAKDLVQDMYLKLYDSKKEINNSYVYSVIKNLFLDSKSTGQEIKDEIQWSEPDYDLINELGLDYDAAKKIFDSKKTYQKIIIKESHRIGIREFSIKSGIARCQIQKIINEFRQEVKSHRQDLEIQLQRSPMRLELFLAKDATTERII